MANNLHLPKPRYAKFKAHNEKQKRKGDGYMGYSIDWSDLEQRIQDQKAALLDTSQNMDRNA